MKRLAFVLTLLSSAVAVAQPSETPPPAPPGSESPTEAPSGPVPAPAPAPAGPPMGTTDPSVSPYTSAPEATKPTEPKRGDFNAGGQARFPNGPDEAGNFKSFNWVAADIKARYYLLKTVTANFNMPLAVKKPDTVMLPTGGTADPSIFGGFTLNLDARLLLEKGSFPLMRYDTDIGLAATFGYMREGAMLLSEKDYPLFTGSMKPGTALGVITKLKLGSVLDFSLLPAWVYQKGTAESLQAIQIPMALGIGIGSLVKLNLELGVFTGDDYSLRAKNGGRLATGASLDVRISHILLHAGAGAASLLVDQMGVYPTIGDSFYVDLNAKYVK